MPSLTFVDIEHYLAYSFTHGIISLLICFSVVALETHGTPYYYMEVWFIDNPHVWMEGSSCTFYYWSLLLIELAWPPALFLHTWESFIAVLALSLRNLLEMDLVIMFLMPWRSNLSFNKESASVIDDIGAHTCHFGEVACSCIYDCWGLSRLEVV